MRQKLDPSTIVRTSDFTGFEGLRVLIREWPRNGGFDTGRKGSPYFQLGYRPVEEHGHTLLRFGEAPELDIKMTRVSAIVPPAKPFEVNYCDADGKIATFEIESRFMADVIGRASIVPMKLERVPPARFFINRSVDHLCSLLMHETELGVRTGPLYFESLATALVIAVVSQTDSRLPDAGNLYLQNQHVQKALSYIEANFRSKLTLPKIAAASCLSTFYFSRLFSRIVGLTPHEYVLQYRLRVAEKLLCLRGVQCSIAEIAADSGFYDQAHFSRHFHRAFGKSPQQYRSSKNRQKVSKGVLS